MTSSGSSCLIHPRIRPATPGESENSPLVDRSVWANDTLKQLAERSRRLQQSLRRAKGFRLEAQRVTNRLTTTYDEISLLYAINDHPARREDEGLAALATRWLQRSLPVECVVILEELEKENVAGEVEYKLHSAGKNSPPLGELLALVAELPSTQSKRNKGGSLAVRRPSMGLRDAIAIPIQRGGATEGWVFAINHRDSDSLGSVEESLVRLIANLLRGRRDKHLQAHGDGESLAAIVCTLTNAIDERDACTRGHSERVAKTSVRLGQELGCTETELNRLYVGGLLHDIGKVGLEDGILQKTLPLTSQERLQIQRHPEIGVQILENIPELSPVLPIVLHHHEQWNGTGYPHGLRGLEIPRLTRIASVADAFDAMSSSRTYRRGMERARVARILAQGAGTQWDPQVVNAYFAARRDIDEIQYLAAQPTQ